MDITTSVISLAVQLRSASNTLGLKSKELSRPGTKRDIERILQDIQDLDVEIQACCKASIVEQEDRVWDVVVFHDLINEAGRLKSGVKQWTSRKEAKERLRVLWRLGSAQVSISDLRIVEQYLQVVELLLRVMPQTIHRRQDRTINLKISQLYVQSRTLLLKNTPEDMFGFLGNGSHGPRHHRYRSLRLPQTCDWFLKSKEYNDWKSSRDLPSLWCQGSPGVGKSVLMSSVVDQFIRKTNSDSCFAYFYLARGKVQSATDLLAGILQQVGQTYEIPSDLVKKLQLYGQKTSLMYKDIRTIFKDLLEHQPTKKSIRVVIDGLDEDNMRNTERFDDALETLLENGCQLLVFSRSQPRQVVSKHFDQIYSITSRLNEDDLRLMVKSLIGTNTMVQEVSRDIERLEQQLEERVVSTADGRFFRCEAQMRRVLRQPTPGRLKELFNKLYDDEQRQGVVAIDWTLATVFKWQSNEARDIAQRTMAWLCYAKLPLSIDGLCEALTIASKHRKADIHSIDPDEVLAFDQVYRSCKGLVWADEASKTAAIAHHDLQDRIPRYPGIKPEIREFELGSTCVVYLLFDVFADGPCKDLSTFRDRLSKCPFISYAACSWLPHIWRSCVWSRKDSGVGISVLKFLSSPKHMAAAAQVYLWVEQDHESREESFQEITKRSVSLCSLQLTGMMNLEQLILQEPGSTAPRQLYPHVASLTSPTDVDFERLAGLLVSRLGRSRFEDHLAGELIVSDYKTCSAFGHRLLYHAIRQDDVELLKRILQRGIIWPTDTTMPRSNPLTEAILRPEPSIAIIEELLKADLVSGGRGKSPLQAACETGSMKIVHLLLRHRAGFEAPADSDSEPPLFLAIMRADAELVSVLLGSGVSTAQCNRNEDSALQCAARVGDENVLRLLLANSVGSSWPDVSLEDASNDGVRRILKQYIQMRERHMRHMTTNK